MPTLHPELEAFFVTHKTATAECKRAAHDTLGTIMQVCDMVTNHVTALTTQLTAAELASHDHAIDPKLEWMHTRLSAVADRAAMFRATGRDLARALVEVERGFDDDYLKLVARVQAVGEPPT